MTQELPEGTYVELVRSLLQTLLPTSIMAVSFITVGLIINLQTPDPLLAVITVAGSIAVIARLVVLLLHRGLVADETLEWRRARVFERLYAFPYLGFAMALGAFSARAFVVAAPDAHMLVVGLLFGYGAGVAAGLALRPWISIPSILVAVVPTIGTSWLFPDITHRAVGLLFAAFLAGAVESMVSRYQTTAAQITMRRLFSTLARSDELTKLPNRLSMRERFDALQMKMGEGESMAIHCLDLDRFKPVNDCYGHPVGDALLKAVSERLNGQLRRTDFAARTGGDEFIVVQTGLAHPGEADLLARRLVRAVALPYAIEGHEVTIGTSVGYALSSDHGKDLDRLIAYADDALCRIKRSGGGIARYHAEDLEAERRLSA